MSTKFISSEGFSAIKSLGTKNRYDRFLSKLLRFFRRVPKEIRRDLNTIKKKYRDLSWDTMTFGKFFTGIKRFHFPDSYLESLKTPRGVFNLAAPVLATVVLVLTVCFWTCSSYSINVSLNGEHLATIDNETVLISATAQVNNALSGVDATVATATPVMQVSSPSLSAPQTDSPVDVYAKLVDCNDGIVADACGLYIDGVLFGTTDNSDLLMSALTAELNKAKEGYDSTTVTTFENEVKVETGVYPSEGMMDAQELVDRVKQNFSIRLETDFEVEYEKAYSVIYEYDDSQPDNYSETKQEGQSGMQTVKYRLVYIDGMQTDAVPVSTTVTKEAIDKIVVVGTQPSGAGSGSFVWPVPAAHNISSLFEYRWGSFHSGIDIADIGIDGQDIVASDSGTVTWAGWDSSGYGNYVIIDHGNGYTTLYGHCSAVYVSVGDTVTQGDVIAAVGSTGYSTGSHLHFEICDNGTKVNPVDYLDWDYTIIYY